MKKTTRILAIVSVAMDGNCSVAALWCMVETMAGVGRYSAGDGQTLPFWGSALWDLLKRLGGLACSQTALPTLVVPLTSQLTKGEWIQHKMGQKVSVLLWQPRAWKDREGEKRNTFSHDSQEWPGLIWLYFPMCFPWLHQELLICPAMSLTQTQTGAAL